MICSSCDRFTRVKLSNDREALGGTENPAKWTRLAQARGVFVGGFEEREKVRQWLVEQALPFEQVGRGTPVGRLQPARNV